jgi:hypothetical protein
MTPAAAVAGGVVPDDVAMAVTRSCDKREGASAHG